MFLKKLSVTVFFYLTVYTVFAQDSLQYFNGSLFKSSGVIYQNKKYTTVREINRLMLQLDPNGDLKTEIRQFATKRHVGSIISFAGSFIVGWTIVDIGTRNFNFPLLLSGFGGAFLGNLIANQGEKNLITAIYRYNKKRAEGTSKLYISPDFQIHTQSLGFRVRLKL